MPATGAESSHTSRGSGTDASALPTCLVPANWLMYFFIAITEVVDWINKFKFNKFEYIQTNRLNILGTGRQQRQGLNNLLVLHYMIVEILLLERERRFLFRLQPVVFPSSYFGSFHHFQRLGHGNVGCGDGLYLFVNLCGDNVKQLVGLVTC